MIFEQRLEGGHGPRYTDSWKNIPGTGRAGAKRKVLKSGGRNVPEIFRGEQRLMWGE